MKKKVSRSRNYCFTDFELLKFKEIYDKYNDIIRYIGFGLEICPKTKKRHNQGWIQFFNPKRMTRVKSLLGTKKIHIEACKGKEIDNENYCQKENKFTSFGHFITQGQRTDLENIKHEIDSGKTRKEIMDSNFETYCRYRNGINDYIKEVENSNRSAFRKLKVEYIYGETGSGKTRYGMKKAHFKLCANNLKWWDGYNGEKSILIDDYDNDVNITKMLNILDGYKLRLSIKGGFTYANWNQVFITSNLNPDQLHPHAKPAHRRALFRRITKVTLLSQSAAGNTNNCSTAQPLAEVEKGCSIPKVFNIESGKKKDINELDKLINEINSYSDSLLI